MSRPKDCHLCGQIRGDAASDLIACMLPDQPYVRRILLESSSFAVIPSLGPLTSGHSLLCPKAHVRSFAQLSPAGEPEYLALKTGLRTALGEIYGPGVALFEHGMARTGDRVLCTVDHAHLHFVPVPQAFDLGISGAPGWMAFDGSLAALHQLAGAGEYILYESPEGESWILTAEDRVLESQYMRRIIARHLGNTASWNWREAPAPLAAHDAWLRFTRV
jgi:ATP adenylyltransferase